MRGRGIEGTPPILIVGMHRSGTSLLAQMISRSGVFLGYHSGKHTEARFFVDLNRWILQVASAKWDNPEPALLLSGQELEHVVGFVDDTLRSPRSIEYLGVRKYLQFGDPRGLAGDWGWKDPRNSFTLPVWLRLMPELRVVHIVRHGVDVARSLHVRQATHLARTTDSASSTRYRFRRLAPVLPRPHQHVGSLRCRTLEGAFELWETYMDAERDALSALPNDRVYEIRYEDLVRQPEDVLVDTSDALDLSLSEIPEAIRAVAGQYSLAYRNDPTLVAFEESVADRLAPRGYLPGS